MERFSDAAILRHWPICYTRIGYRRSMVRRELCTLLIVNHSCLLCQHRALADNSNLEVYLKTCPYALSNLFYPCITRVTPVILSVQHKRSNAGVRSHACCGLYSKTSFVSFGVFPFTGKSQAYKLIRNISSNIVCHHPPHKACQFPRYRCCSYISVCAVFQCHPIKLSP